MYPSSAKLHSKALQLRHPLSGLSVWFHICDFKCGIHISYFQSLGFFNNWALSDSRDSRGLFNYWGCAHRDCELEASVHQERLLSTFPLSSDCPFGTFGMECKQTCSCQSGICDRVTGKCLKFPFFQYSTAKATNQRFVSHTGKNWFPGKHWNHSLIFSLSKKNYEWVEQDVGLNDFVSFILLMGKVGGCWNLLQCYKETSLIIFRLYNFSKFTQCTQGINMIDYPKR